MECTHANRTAESHSQAVSQVRNCVNKEPKMVACPIIQSYPAAMFSTTTQNSVGSLGVAACCPCSC